jgi:hypothetical protein
MEIDSTATSADDAKSKLQVIERSIEDLKLKIQQEDEKYKNWKV